MQEPVFVINHFASMFIQIIFQNILGHKSSKMTEIYTHMITLFMDKLSLYYISNNLFSEEVINNND